MMYPVEWITPILNRARGLITSAVASATALAQGYANSASASASTATTKSDLAVAAWAAASNQTQTLVAVDTSFFPVTTLVTAKLFSTRDDYKGGEWRKQCQDKSWYTETIYGNQIGVGYYANEAAARAVSGVATNDYYYDTTAATFKALNAGSGTTTIYRGGRREFPESFIVTVESARVVIWDTDFGAPRMWKAHKTPGGSSISGGIDVKNGSVVVCFGNSSYLSGWWIDYIRDCAETIDGANSSATQRIYTKTLAGNPSYSVGTCNLFPAVTLADRKLNAVAITTLPNAPLDEYGIPKPTIAVGTDGGVTVLGWDGVADNVTWDIVVTSYKYVNQVGFGADGRVSFTVLDSAGGAAWLISGPLPTTDVSFAYHTMPTGYSSVYGVGDADQNLAVFPSGTSTGGTYAKVNPVAGNRKVRATTSYGLEIFRENPATPVKGMGAKITHTYNSGTLVGDIRRAWLADTTAETITGGTQPDRCIKNKALTVVGSLTKAAVASGANLVAYSGFSATNYLEEAYSSDLDFGTGDFCYIIDFVTGADVGTAQFLFDRADADVSPRIQAYIASGMLVFATVDNSGVTSNVTSSTLTASTRYKGILGRSSAGLFLTLNGISAIASSTTPTTVRNVTSLDSAAKQKVGVRYDNTLPFLGSMCLLRISATAPTAEQIRYIYEQEKKLFEPNAQCTLAGTSSAVLAVDHDDITDVTSVLTSYGRSDIKGLVRVASEATAVGTPKAVSALGGSILQVGSTGIDYYAPAKNLREELPTDLGDKPRQLFDFDLSSATTCTLPQGWKPTGAVWSAGAKKRYGAAKDFLTSYDGFLWSVVMNASTTAWVQVEGEMQ